MSTVIVEPLECIGQGERGSTYTGAVRETRDFILIQRVAGSISGNTYHTGICENTNPKVFVLLNGEIIFRYRGIEDATHEERRLDAPCVINVPANITHSVEAVSDIHMLECNSLSDIENDRHHLPVVTE